MSARIPKSRVGYRLEVLDGPPRPREPRKKMGARPQHLAFIRQLPCLVCGSHRNIEAAHVRNGVPSDQKGMGMKPPDRFTVPLCHSHHEEQHRKGEVTFWGEMGIDPLDAAARLWAVTGDLDKGRWTVFRFRQRLELSR